MRWHHWRRHYHRWVLLPKCPFAFCIEADCHLNDLCHLTWASAKDPVHEDQTCYCTQVRVTLGEGGGDQPLPPHAWTSLLIADMFQDGLKNELQKKWPLPLGRQPYSLLDNSSKRGYLLVMQGMLDSALATQSIRLEGRLRWKKTMSTVVNGCWAIADAIMEKKTKARYQDTPEEQWRPTRPQQEYTTLKSGCEAWEKRREMMKWVIMGLCGGMLILNMWIGDKAPHN